MPCSSNGSHFPIKPVLLITFPGCAHVALRGKLTLLAPVMRCQGLRDCGGNENMWWFARSTAGVLLWLFLTGLVFVKAWHFFFFPACEANPGILSMETPRSCHMGAIGKEVAVGWVRSKIPV